MTTLMTIVCSTHNPNNVTIVNNSISRFIFVSVALKVYFLFAKKLKQNEIVVDARLAPMTGSPSDFKIKSKPKSSSVLKLPTTKKRIFCWLFFMMT